MGSIGIVWEYLIQYGNTKTGMGTKLPNSNTKFADKAMFVTNDVD